MENGLKRFLLTFKNSIFVRSISTHEATSSNSFNKRQASSHKRNRPDVGLHFSVLSVIELINAVPNARYSNGKLALKNIIT